MPMPISAGQIAKSSANLSHAQQAPSTRIDLCMHVAVACALILNSHRSALTRTGSWCSTAPQICAFDPASNWVPSRNACAIDNISWCYMLHLHVESYLAASCDTSSHDAGNDKHTQVRCA